MIRVGIIGLGHWGPNYIRNFASLENAQIVACADLDEARLKTQKRWVPNAFLTSHPEEILKHPDVDAVIIATPTNTHYPLAHQALSLGKHLLVEKPLALTIQEARDLDALAKSKKRILMVGHTFLYNPGVQALKRIIKEGQLGKIHYINAMRANLGPIRQDVNALIDLAPHDISILLYLLETMPLSVSAQGACFLDPAREDVAFMTLRFPDNVLAQVHVSWIEPVKVRRVTTIGNKKMVVFNDIDAVEPIRIYDKGVSFVHRSYADFNEFRLMIREGDLVAPKIAFSEPLKNECIAFIEAIEKNENPVSDGRLGTQVVEILSAAMQSLKSNGSPVSLASLSGNP